MDIRRSETAAYACGVRLSGKIGNLVNEVFSGEYESGHDGSGLTIVDIGANIGAFAVWASLRWPGSTIHCYEANPETFPYLKRNTAADPRIHCMHVAVYPGGQTTMPFFYRFAGDGEAGLSAYMGETFRNGVDGHICEVSSSRWPRACSGPSARPAPSADRRLANTYRSTKRRAGAGVLKPFHVKEIGNSARAPYYPIIYVRGEQMRQKSGKEIAASYHFEAIARQRRMRLAILGGR